MLAEIGDDILNARCRPDHFVGAVVRIKTGQFGQRLSKGILVFAGHQRHFDPQLFAQQWAPDIRREQHRFTGNAG